MRLVAVLWLQHSFMTIFYRLQFYEYEIESQSVVFDCCVSAAAWGCGVRELSGADS